MLDVDGDGLLTFPEMLESIKEAFTAREAEAEGAARAGGEREAAGTGVDWLGPLPRAYICALSALLS